jgi:ubiquinol-cytochrome c reductase cytochrome b subunit
VKALLEFLESRTGERPFSALARLGIPGGPRFAHSTGGLVLLFIVLQALTGFVLALHYAPSVGTAWASIVFFEERIRAGSFIRGLHSWGASAIVILVVLHFVVTVARGAHRTPREVSWILGLLLALLVLVFAHTGYLLPWDQKGYWSTRVATGIAGSTPVVGPALQRLAVGGEDAGNLTLTRFYAVHVIFLPFLLILLVRAHLRTFARNGPAGEGAPTPYFPGQALRDLAVFSVAFGALAFLAHRIGPSLEAPADPSSDFRPRPEWYFLPLYQFLKLLPGRLEFVGAEVIPGIVFALFIALPWIDRRSRKAALAVAFVPLGLAALLGGAAAMQDRNDSDLAAHRKEEAKDAALARRLFKDNGGVPVEGPLALLDRYPPRLGARVWKDRCASCHAGANLKGPDLTGYLSPRWLEDVIRDPAAKFGEIDSMGKTPGKPDEIAALAVYVFSLESAEAAALLKADQVARGKALFSEKQCDTCHDVKPGKSSDEGPNLAGYGSPSWLAEFVKKPARFYVSHDKMPAFEDKLTEGELRAVVDHVRSLRNPEED